MNNITFKILYAALIIAMNAIRMHYAGRYKKYHSKEQEVAPRREKLLTQMMSITMAVPGVLWLFTSWLDFAQFAVPNVVRVVGFAVGTYSMWFFYRIHKTLGNNWSPVLKTRREHILIISGAYRRLRHPMYSAMMLWAISFVMLTANWFYAITLCTGLIILFVLRIPDEEKMMLARFGSQYREYMQCTKRLIPFIY